MKLSLKKLITPIVLSLISASLALGQNSATQRLTFEVKPVSKITVSEDPLPLVIAPGTGISTTADQSGRYSVVSNLRSMRITASIDRPMPSGTSLAIRLESSAGVSSGDVDITRAIGSTEVVTGIRPGNDREQRITYRFSASPGISDVPSQSRIVTLTLTD